MWGWFFGSSALQWIKSDQDFLRSVRTLMEHTRADLLNIKCWTWFKVGNYHIGICLQAIWSESGLGIKFLNSMWALSLDFLFVCLLVSYVICSSLLSPHGSMPCCNLTKAILRVGSCTPWQLKSSEWTRSKVEDLRDCPLEASLVGGVEEDVSQQAPEEVEDGHLGNADQWQNSTG